MFDYLMVSTLSGNFKKEVYFLFYVCMCVCACVNTEESVGFPGAGTAGSCQLPEWVLRLEHQSYVSSKCSQLLRHLSSP